MFFLEAFEKLEERGIVINDILATGGSRSDLWLQIKADMLGRPVKGLATASRGQLVLL